MTTLYIVGNGFDLWHDLPTDYGSFYEYAKDFLDEMEGYFITPASVDQPWHDFEHCLGKYDWGLFYDSYNEIDVTSDSFRPSEVYGLEDELVEQSRYLVGSIESYFYEWVAGIDISGIERKFIYDSDSLFLTFNYTATLQRVYGVPNDRVFHIHGSAEISDKLIFGHGETREEEPEIDENGDSNRTMFTDAEGAAQYPFYALQKPVEKVIEGNMAYFSSLYTVKQVVVIGHSLNDIDLPYFRAVADSTAGCAWLVYYYDQSHIEHHRGQLMRCGVDRDRIKYMHIDMASHDGNHRV